MGELVGMILRRVAGFRKKDLGGLFRSNLAKKTSEVFLAR
jgi:hypothetical protein